MIAYLFSSEIFCDAKIFHFISTESVYPYFDGTFHVAPSIFFQLYCVNSLFGNTMIYLAYFLLPSKSKETYIDMFHMIKGKASNVSL